jgi:hypothetical protein
MALGLRYGSNPAFVSIAISGPGAASAEMTTASDGSAVNPQTQFGTPIAPNDMWRQLEVLEYPNQAAYQWELARGSCSREPANLNI